MRRQLALGVHLARREIGRANRWTLLGWTWPLARQLVQLAVLVFAFSVVFDLDIERYPLFVFTGLIAWTWFSTALGAASWSVLRSRHLVMQPAFPRIVVPFVAVTVPMVDVLLALPVVAVLLVDAGGVSAHLVVLPVVIAIQWLLTAGVALIVAPVSAYARDVPNVVVVATSSLFYLTPVFYPLDRVPADYRWALELNPVGQLVEAYRAIVIAGTWPDWAALGLVLALGVALLAAGAAIFERLAPGLPDVL